MDALWRGENVLIGQGGSNPGIGVYDMETHEIGQTWSLPPGQSVYALAASPDGTRLAGGTKGGLLYHMFCSPSHGGDDMHPHRITQGFPVLSMCFVDSDTVAVCDNVGRCLLWCLEGQSQPRGLPTGGSTVYSLFRLGDDTLAGLTLDGRLLVWQWLSGTVVREVQIPLPPKYIALVKPVSWLAADAWVWPGQRGAIVLYHINSGDIEVMQGHDGDVYAVAICGDELLTVGRDDGLMECWPHGGTEPSKRCEAPLGVIAAAAWKDSECKIILADDHGGVCEYDMSGDTLRFVRALKSRHVRVIVGPDQERLDVSLREKRLQRSREIAGEIQRRYVDHGGEGVEELHHQLVQLGCEHVSFALKAERANSNGDLVSELEYTKGTAELICEREPGASGLLLRYATLLESVWQHPIAHQICRKLMSFHPGDELSQRVRRLDKYTRVLRTGGYVIDSELPLRTLIESASVLEMPLQGLYSMGRHSPRHTGPPGITSTELIRAYERVCRTNPDMPVPSASEVTLHWLSKTRMERVHMVLFDGGMASPIAGLQCGLKLYDVGLQTVVVAVRLFDADSGLGRIPTDHHGSNVDQLLNLLENEVLIDGWFSAVEKLIDEALGIATNEKHAWSRRRLGAENGTVPTESHSMGTGELPKIVLGGALSENR